MEDLRIMLRQIEPELPSINVPITAVPTAPETAGFRRYTSCSSFSHCCSSCHPLADGHPHHHFHHDTNRHSHTPSNTHHFSTDVTYATPQTRPILTPATPNTQHRNLSPEKPKMPRTLNPPINPTVHRLSISRILLQILHQIQIVTLII